MNPHNIRFTTQDTKPFSENFFFQYTNSIPFHNEVHSIHTIPLLREVLGSQLFYIRYKT